MIIPGPDGHKVHTFPVVWVRIDGFTDRVPGPRE